MYACVPWVKSLLSGVFGLESVVNSGFLRFIVIDGSTVQEPGATGTTYRPSIAIDLINLSIRQVEVTTDKVGESLDHYQLDGGDVVLIDRGYHQPKTLLVPFLDRGSDGVLCYNAPIQLIMIQTLAHLVCCHLNLSDTEVNQVYRNRRAVCGSISWGGSINTKK